MIVLGFDTATSATAVALAGTGAGPRERRDDPAAGAHPGHATRLLAMVEELLSEAHTELAAVGRIAVGAGPGTFTGLRVGIASARGLAQSLGCELALVSSLRALALGARSASQEIGGPLLATIDARRGEVFAAAYSGAGEQLATPRALAPADLGALIAEAGLAGERLTAVGDGAIRYREELAGCGAEVPADGSPLHLVRAAAICELGLEAVPVPYGQALPEYLRRPDAELALEAAGGGA